jgi:hypothetical protein
VVSLLGASHQDGARIAFVAGVGEGNDIFTMDVDGANQMKLIKQ